MRALALLIPALLAAGCAGVSVEGLQRADEPREPHYEEHHDLVAPQHERAYPVPVEPGARAVNLTLHLVARASGVPLPGAPAPPGGEANLTAAPARLVLDLLDPSGRAAGRVMVDPAAPAATLLLADPLPAGEWTARVTGAGASGRVEGQDYGASYLLTVEVVYA